MTTVSVLTLIAALIAATVAGIGVYFQRKSGREAAAASQRSADAANRSADAATVSAAASDRSSKAAEQSVQVNERIAEQVGRRAVADAFAKRYQDAASQLGHDKASVRLAGVHAMVGLADDWEERRQVCVNVLCGYLSVPRESDDDRSVRSAIFSSLREHLGISTKNRWAEIELKFENMVLEDADLTGIYLERRLIFNDVQFLGYCRLTGAEFDNGLEISDAKIDGELSLAWIHVNAGRIDIRNARIAHDCRLFIGVFEVGRALNLDNITVDGELTIRINFVKVPAGELVLNHVLVAPDGNMVLAGEQFLPTPQGKSLPHISIRSLTAFRQESLYIQLEDFKSRGVLDQADITVFDSESLESE